VSGVGTPIGPSQHITLCIFPPGFANKADRGPATGNSRGDDVPRLKIASCTATRTSAANKSSCAIRVTAIDSSCGCGLIALRVDNEL
jgi:hypothetical protein